MPHSNQTFYILHAPASGDRVVASLILPVLEEMRSLAIQPIGVLCLYTIYEDDSIKEKTKAFVDVIDMAGNLLTSTAINKPTIAFATVNYATTHFSNSGPDDIDHLDDEVKLPIAEFWARSPTINSTLYVHDGTSDSGAEIIQYLIDHGNPALYSMSSDGATETDDVKGKMGVQESPHYQQRRHATAFEPRISEGTPRMMQMEDMEPLSNESVAEASNTNPFPRDEFEIERSQDYLPRSVDTLEKHPFETETPTFIDTHPEYRTDWLEMKMHLAEMEEQIIEVQDMWRHDHVNLRRRVSELQTRVTSLSPKTSNHETVLDSGGGTQNLYPSFMSRRSVLTGPKTSGTTLPDSSTVLPDRLESTTSEVTVPLGELASHSTQVNQVLAGISTASSLASPNGPAFESHPLRSQGHSMGVSIDDDLHIAARSTTESGLHSLDAVLNTSQHYRSLEELEHRVVQFLGLDRPRWSESQAWLNANSTDNSYKQGLAKLVGAFSIIHDTGFCGDEFSILIEDQDRKDVALACAITSDELRSLRDSFAAMTDSYSARARVTFDSLSINLSRRLQGTTQSEYINREIRPVGEVPNSGRSSTLKFIYRVLALGLISFTGSHVCRFDQSTLDESCEGFDVGEGYKFVLRDLACLERFIGGPVWVLVKDTTILEAPKLKVSLTLQQFAGLWGPLWTINGPQDSNPLRCLIRTERGYIVPSPDDNSKRDQSREVECHWMAELPVSTYNGLLSTPELNLFESSQLLIGSENAGQEPFHVNAKCCTRIEMAGQRVAKYLQVSGTSAAHYISDGYEFGLSGNQYIGMIGTKTWKRIPARTQKTVLVEQCTKPETPLVPILKLRIGLEVSACTGNAQRTTLWDALRLAQKRSKDTLLPAPGQHDTAKTCSHGIGDIDCMQSCWNIQRNLDGIDAVPNTQLDQKTLRKTIIQSILMLQDTGVDHNEELQAWWPFTDAPMTRRIPQLEPADGITSYWIPILKDTRDCSTFAVLSQRCLEFRDKGLRRACYKSKISSFTIEASGAAKDKSLTIAPNTSAPIDTSFKTDKNPKDPTVLKTRFALEVPLTSKKLWPDPTTTMPSSSAVTQAKIEGPLLGKGACLEIGQGTILTVARAMGKAPPPQQQQPQTLILKRARLTMDFSHASRWVQHRIRGKASRGFEQICDDVSTGYSVDVFVY
ncbi:hypothetical protein LTR84_007704 [Exophiala bonariae]|uniref:Uncharacterized protein n=1 Tax=Exophiala bonariae TaxID=1690606 RepID=A0AAV9NL91_9EURO|nr:hypothetical protein LTR84_007704 [Exophiala bonariae]